MADNQFTFPGAKAPIDVVGAEGIRYRLEMNGERLETYVITGARGSGVICLNGAAARRAQVGDTVIIIAYAWMEEDEARAFQPKVVFPVGGNLLPV